MILRPCLKLLFPGYKPMAQLYTALREIFRFTTYSGNSNFIPPGKFELSNPSNDIVHNNGSLALQWLKGQIIKIEGLVSMNGS